MTVELLIHAIVRQTMILIAQIATAGGGRAPLAQVASQVFLDLVKELERQGVSRKVSADMFGLGLRTYRRKIQRLSESATERGRSLWEVVLEFIESNPGVTRNKVLLRFSRDDEAQVRAVLRDLCDSQLVASTGAGPTLSYRALTDEERVSLRSSRSDEGLEEFVVALIYREGALSLADVAARAQASPAALEGVLERLVEGGRITRSEGDDGARFQASHLVIPLDAVSGWEAAMFDHFKALVATMMVRLNLGKSTGPADPVGGSTYTIDVWPGHPLEAEVLGSLAKVRASLSDLRARVADYNKTNARPERYSRVVTYAGQYVIDEDSDA